MATEEEANHARELHSDLLAKRGAHAVGVAEGRDYGKPGFVLVAYVDPRGDHDIPKSIETKRAGKSFQIDVVTKPSEPFQQESLA